MITPSRMERATVIVAGGGRGIGRAVSARFAELGAFVYVADTNRLSTSTNQYKSTTTTGFDEATALARELAAVSDRARAVECNVEQEDEVQALFARARRERGTVDVVVNAFGVTHVSPVEQLQLSDFTAILSGNLTGVFLMTKYAIPILREGGGGAIVNFSSVSGKRGFAKVSHYCAAKYAIIGFSSSVALEVAKWNIRVNAICPGIVRSAMWDYLLEQFRRSGETEQDCWNRMCAMIPQGAGQTPESLADAVVMLACSKSITGQAISVDGGMTA